MKQFAITLGLFAAMGIAIAILSALLSLPLEIMLASAALWVAIHAHVAALRARP
jgi:predicted RND superfamily exporter protein